MIAWNTDTLYNLTVTLANGYEKKWEGLRALSGLLDVPPEIGPYFRFWHKGESPLDIEVRTGTTHTIIRDRNILMYSIEEMKEGEES